jgi:hypothetical protein
MKKATIWVFFILLSSCTKKEVEKIDLSGLNLTQIPDSVFTHPELKELYLGSEGFVLYPPLSGIKPQTGNSNNLTELDNRISQLKNLKILNLVSNQLRELPESITDLKNLEDLDLSLNHDLNIVDEISKLKQLPKLKTLKIVDVQFRQQGEIVKQALEPRVRVITSIDEYFSLDSVATKKSIDSLAKKLKTKAV